MTSQESGDGLSDQYSDFKAGNNNEHEMFLDKNEENDSQPAVPFERVLKELGMPGRFQLTQVAMFYVSMFFSACIMFSFVFIGYEPSHVCNTLKNETEFLASLDLENISATRMSYQSCDISVYVNRSGTEEEVAVVNCPSGRNFSTEKYTSILAEWDTVCESSGVSELVALSFAIGQFLGGIIGAPISDRYGRKTVMWFVCTVMWASETIIIFVPNLWSIGILRFISGMCMGSHNCAGFVFTTELMTARQRDMNGIAVCAIWVATTLTTGAVAYLTQGYGWRGFQVGTAVLGSIFPVYMIVLKESPRWLAVKGRITDALDVLEFACKQNGKDFSTVKKLFLEYVSFENMPKEQKQTKDEHSTSTCPSDINFETPYQRNQSFLRLFFNRKVVTLILILIFAWVTFNLTYYGMYMTSSTLSGDRYLNFCLVALTEIPSNIALYLLMPRMSRRTLLIIFMALSAACLLACSMVATFAEDIPNSDTLSLVFFLAGKLTVTTTYNLIYIYTPEIFPTNIRATGFAICCSIGGVGLMVSPYLRPFYAIAVWGPSVLFCSMSVVSLFLIPMLPEMKGVNLKDTVDQFIDFTSHPLNSEANRV